MSSNTILEINSFILDIRWDLFNEDSNPGMNIIQSSTSLTTTESTCVEKLHVSQKDKGLQIVNIAKKRVHILYDDGDKILLRRQNRLHSNKFKTKVSAIGRFAGHSVTLYRNFIPSLKTKLSFTTCENVV